MAAPSPPEAPRASPEDAVQVLHLDGQGGAVRVPLTGPGEGCWVHLGEPSAGSARTLREVWGLEESLVQALTGPLARSRVEEVASGELLLLVSLPVREQGPSGELRALCSASRLVTLTRGLHPAFQVQRERLERGRGAKGLPELQRLLISDALDLAQLRIVQLNEETEALQLDEEGRPQVSETSLGRMRLAIIAERRILLLFQDVLLRVLLVAPPFLQSQLPALRVLSERATALMGELDTLHERVRTVQEALHARQDAHTQRILYLLTLISGVFLPLSFLTGLLGVNIGGLPLQHRWGFALVCGVLVALAVTEWQLLRRRKLL